MANLDFLENPDVGQKEKTIYINAESTSSMKLYCRGGDHCCTNDSCDEGEGDCNDDNECKGSLVCGDNNCGQSGGMWDAEDDCCERRCTSEHPCKEGGGHCVYDSDCENSGWLLCGNDRCLDKTYFPRNVFINNSETYFSSSDNCCYRRCNKAYYLCGQNEVGCLGDDDCHVGYYCHQDTAQPYCTDINECSYGNGKYEGLLYCGQHTTCSNSVGSFSCTCKTGFIEFVEHDGCRDKNECTEGGHNCAANADCWNTVGSFVCTCKVGYTGNPTSKCYDIDECSNPEWNSCAGGNSPLLINTELFKTNGFKVFDSIGPFDINDGNEYKFRFDMSGKGKTYVTLGEESNHYLFQFNIGFHLYYCTTSATSESACDHFHAFGTMNDPYRLRQTRFTSYWVSFQMQDDMIIKFGINENTGLFSSKTHGQYKNNPFVINEIKMRAAEAYVLVRNFKLETSRGMECYNTVGSYACFSTDDEKVAIGFGGHTTDGAVYPAEFTVVTKDRFSCSDHTIKDLGGRYSPGMAALHNQLYVCGGHYYGWSYPLNDCKKFNINAYNANWKEGPTLPQRRRDFVMLTYGNSIYALGGYEYWSGGSTCINTMHELNHQTNQWTAKATMPIANHRFCAVADEEDDKIYMIGGHTCGCCDRSEVYVYTVSSNSWTQHSTLTWGQSSIDPACNIIEQSNGDKWLLLVRGGRSEAVHYYDLTNNQGWTHVANLYGNYNQHYAKMITLDKYTALLIGSKSQRYGTSLKNFFEFNYLTSKFEDYGYYLQNEMLQGQWTTVKRNKNFNVLTDCVSLRKYVAVGWGGHTSNGNDYPPHWSIVLKDRLTSGDPHKPATCHRKIPDLSPGKLAAGVTSVDYLLIVCGGHQRGGGYESTCHQLDTNADSPSWSTMASMPTARGYYELLTFSDAVFAIAGWNGGSYISRVDRWTKSTGWEEMASYPISTGRHCAVADETNNRIYSMGGNSRENRFYMYVVSSNTWYQGSNLYWGAHNTACAIIRRRSNGHKILILTGNYERRTQYLDLTASESGAWQVWKDPVFHTKFTAMVSLSPYESYQVYLGFHSKLISEII